MASNTISQRIALEGAEDILKQLADLGKAGEDAVKQIQDATAGAGAGMSPALAGLSGIAATVRSTFGQAGEALAPLREQFVALGEAALVVGEHIGKVAEVLGVGLVGGLAGGIAGIVELIKSSAEFGHQLEVQSQLLGISVEDLQVFRKEAAIAGVDVDKLTTGLTRFSQNVGKENEKLFGDAVKLVQMLPAATSQVGVAIVQGIMPVGTAIKSHIIANIQDTIPQINNLVEVLRRAFSDKGIALPSTFFDAIRQNLLNTGNDATKAAEQIRLLASSLGVNLPAQNVFEQLQRGAEKSKDPLAAVGVTFKDLQDNADNLTPIVLKVADGLLQIQNPTERARISLALFSRGWPEVVKALRDGSAGFDLLSTALKQSGGLLDEQSVEKLSETEKALIRLSGAATGLRNQISVIFAPALTEAAQAFTDLIKDNAVTLKDWARTIATEVLPGITNLISQFRGAGEALPGAMPAHGTGEGGAIAPIDSSGVDNVQTKFAAIRDTVLSVRDTVVTAFTAIKAVLDTVANAINAVFGTNLNAAGLAAVLIVGQLTGVFALLLPLLGLAAAAIAFLATPIGLVTALVGLVVVAIVNWRSALAALQSAAAAVAAGVTADFNTAVGAVSGLLGAVSGTIQSAFQAVAAAISPFFATISGLVQAAVSAIAQVAASIGQAITNAFNTAIANVVDALRGFVDAFANAAQRILGFLQPVFDFISKIASGLASIAGGGGGVPAVGGGDQGDLGIAGGAGAVAGATGGHIVSGPSGIDQIPARLTLGEFVTRTEAVRHYGPGLFHALNAMALPLEMFRGFSLGGMVDAIGNAMMPAPLMLAAGGPVLAPASGSGPTHVLNLTIGNEQFRGLTAPGAVYDNLARHARASAVRSAGRKPGWFTG